MPDKLIRTDVDQMIARGKTPGWQRGTSSLVIANAGVGVHVLHVTWLNDKGEMKYDQILRCESGGGVFLPVDGDGRIGLLKAWRPQTTDMAAWRAAFPNAIDVGALGRESWELPRGFAKLGEAGDAAAVREAQEETGSAVVSARRLGDTCDNTAFSPHLTAIQVGTVDPSRKPADKPDPNEKILAPLTFFSLAAIKRMIADGRVYDGYTLSALGLYLVDKLG